MNVSVTSGWCFRLRHWPFHQAGWCSQACNSCYISRWLLQLAKVPPQLTHWLVVLECFLYFIIPLAPAVLGPWAPPFPGDLGDLVHRPPVLQASNSRRRRAAECRDALSASRSSYADRWSGRGWRLWIPWGKTTEFFAAEDGATSFCCDKKKHGRTWTCNVLMAWLEQFPKADQRWIDFAGWCSRQ